MTRKQQSASVSALNELHATIAEYMIKRIRSSVPPDDYEPEYDENGEEIPAFFIPLAASELQVMVSFLNNNKITATPDAEHMATLAKEFSQELDEARANRARGITKVSDNDAVFSSFLQ